MDRPGEMAVFVRVVEAGSFSAAGRGSGLTPSAVSKLIGRLETRLGARLLHRTTRSISLTHEGVAFYQRCVRILRDIDEAEQAISQLHAVPSGRLRVNAAVAFATYQIVPIIPAYLDQYPHVHLELTITDRVVDVVEEGVDVAIRLGARVDPSLVSRQLAADRRVICAAPEYLSRHGTPNAPSDLARFQCLTWIDNQGGLNDWPFIGPHGPYTVRVSGNIEVDNGETLYEMALAGLGLARIAGFRVGKAIRSGRLIPLLADCHREEPLLIHAVYPHRRHLVPKVRSFVDFLTRTFTPTPPWSTF